MSQDKKSKRLLTRGLATFMLCLVLVAAGVGVAKFFMENKVQPKRAPRTPQPRLVEVLRPEAGDRAMQLEAMGTVVPAREVLLRPEVSGTVLEISPNLTPGGRVAEGELLVRLDPRQYELEVTKAEVAVQSAEADMALEVGQQVVAREELRMLMSDEDAGLLESDLALRKPQLLQAKAKLESAKADLAQARLDLERTELHAPFNALVTTLDVNKGSQVGTQTNLATLVGTDEFWIEAALPLDLLDTLNVGANDNGVPVTVRSQSGKGVWKGRLERLSGTLNQETRMAKGIVVVDSPLDLEEWGGQQLILGEYVSLDIVTAELKNVIALPRGALREGDTIWLANDGALSVVQVAPVGKDKERVYVPAGDGGIPEGAAVIVSELTSPIPGMALRIDGEAPALAEDGDTADPRGERAEAATPEQAGKKVVQ